MSETSSDCCTKCKASFASDLEHFCSNCRFPRRKPCILCGLEISYNIEKCIFCLAPQDGQIFEITPLKKCSCGALVMMSSAACYNCRSVLQVGYVLPQQQKLPNVPSSIEPPQEASHQVSCNVNSGASVSNSDAPSQAITEESSNQLFILNTLSSGQEMPNINPSGIPPSSQQQFSQKAAVEESYNQSQVPSAIHVHESTQPGLEKGENQENCSTYTPQSSNCAISATMSFPYHKSEEETCRDGQSGNELESNNLTATLSSNILPQSISPSLDVHLFSQPPPATSTPSNEPISFTATSITPKHKLHDQVSMVPEKKRTVFHSESGQNATNLYEEGTTRASINHGGENEITKKAPDTHLDSDGNQKMLLDDKGDLPQVQTQKRRRSTPDESDTDTLISKKPTPSGPEFEAHNIGKYGTCAVSQDILTNKNDAQDMQPVQEESVIEEELDSDESPTCDKDGQQQQSHDNQLEVDDSTLIVSKFSGQRVVTSYKMKGKNNPCIWTERPKGFLGHPGEMTKVVFHALLPALLWEFDDTSEVFIRFGSLNLGSWNCDTGPMNNSKADSELYNVTLEVRMWSSILLQGVPYKYCVYTPKTRSIKDAQYERIKNTSKDFPDEFTNRYLKVYNDRIYHQFDTLIYPALDTDTNQGDKNFFQKFAASASSVIHYVMGSSGNEASASDIIEIPTKEKTRALCLKIYLKEIYASLQSGHVAQPSKMIQNILHIYGCLHSPIIHSDKSRLSSNTLGWKDSHLKHVLKDSLVATAKELNNAEGVSCGRRIMVGLVIICILHKILNESEIALELVVAVMQLISFRPDCKKEECQILFDLINDENSKQTLTGAIEKFVGKLTGARTASSHLGLLFNLLTLYHFLKKVSEPFGYLEQDPKQITWHLSISGNIFSKLDLFLNILSQQALVKLYSGLEPLFNINPLLLPVFVCMCPFSGYPGLFEVLPPFYSMARLAYLSDQSSNVPNAQDIPSLLSAIYFQLQKETIHQRIMQNLDSVIYLVQASQSKVNKLLDPYPAIFTGLMTLLLEAVSKILENSNKLNEAMSIAHEAVNHWIKGTIGGEMFGEKVSSNKQLTKLKDEFKVWKHVFSITCPTNVTQYWNSLIHSIVDQRFLKVSTVFLIDVLDFTEANSVHHPMLVEVVVDHLKRSAVELIVSDDNSSIEILRKLQKSKYITKIGNILNERYQIKSLSFEDILEWEAWPGFINIYVQQRVLHNEGLSERDQEICHAAILIFSSVCITVVDGSVDLSVLCKIHGKIESVEKLCQSIASHTDFEHLLQMPFSFKEIMSSMTVRLREYKMFKQLQNHIFTFHQKCHELSIPELSIAAEKYDISSRSISSLCKMDGNNKIVCFYFDSVAPLIPILPQFTLLTTTNPSNTFQKLWNFQVDQYKGRTLKCEEVLSLVWTPVFTRVCQFLDCLKDGSVLLTTVDELLKEYSGDQRKIEAEFKALDKGISECKKQKIDFTWIVKCVQKMLEYKSLHQIASTTKIFLDLKNVLDLTGDFKMVEDLGVQFKDTVEDQTLQYISDNLVTTGQFLQSISNEPMKLDCLKAFVECYSIIKWIRNVTSDVQDLQHFVTIALATASAGEDDYTRDRLSNLRTVGNGFARLIYQLPPNTGCMELVQYCTSLWDTLKRDAALPKKLRDCNEQIEWYKSVKEVQGSVEKSSFGQMNNITNYGSYTVGRSHAKGFQLKPLELIHMYLEERDKPLAQKKYSLDELKDLESKLVLITGKESKERDNVDHFLKVFNIVCHMTDILIQLLQHGHSKYMGWILKFPCTLPNKDDDIVDKLTCILKEMSDDLEEWQDVVAEARSQFYCLNYYTTQQLLLLRKELFHFTNSNYTADLKPDVMALLQSLSSNISQKLVVSHIRGQSVEQDDVEESNMELNDNNSAVGVSPSSTERETAASASKLLSSTGLLPTLLAKDLTDNQKMILENLMESFGYSEKFVLLAFEHITKPYIEEEVEKWCMEHEEDYKYDDNEADEDIMDLSSENVFDNEFQSSFHTDHKLIELPLIREKAAVKVCEVIPVNEEHPNVKDMLLSGYALEQALEAVETYPDNIEKAMEYIDSFDNVNDNMKGLFPKVILERQQSSGSYATDIEIVCDVSVKSFLTLQQLAKILEKLSAKCSTSIKFERKFPEVLKKGEPNLIIVSSADVHKTVLSLYMENKDLPLPTYEEVLLCNKSTTSEEVSLLWRKATGDPNYFRLFCLVHAELLSYQVCDSAIKSLQEFTQGKTDYKVVIVCSEEDQKKSHMIAKLQNFKRSFSIIYKDADFSQYLSNHFTNWPKCFSGDDILASNVDPANSCVRVVRSTRAGMGKSLYIQRMKEELISKRKSTPGLCDVVIPVHGPKVTFDSIIQSLKETFDTSQDGSQACIFHFDISPNVLKHVDSLLLSLLILRAVSDSQGRIWRCHPTHFYVIEVTVLKEEKIYAKSSVTLLNLLPTIECHSPNHVLHILKNAVGATHTRTVDSKEFRSEQFQRVYEYLRRHTSNMSVDWFSYIHNPEFVAEDPVESLQLYLYYCGVKNPSWSELKHFVEFLNVQLSSCEKSVFCNEEVMSGLKAFVTKFMIRMSKDFATSSLKGEVAVENQEYITDHEQLQVYEIDARKQWEQSYHPYLFFNKDHSSITFFGFNVNPDNGNIQDPVTNEVIEYRAMTPQLYASLKQNQVNLLEDYRYWDKFTMIQKIGMVMGLEWIYDPDPSYVLTVDNVIKIMAIHMRFRCNIPVIIMGETGCGKTRLIRYMCNIVAQCCKNGDSDVQNMLIMKVHGGTTECDVIKTVEKAEKIASINRTQHDIDTILFFDEANTSDAIGLIKEVMCDRRINGRPIEEDVKFIAACNPYRRHTSDMIKKLESAGLGFFVEAAKIQHKLGKTPLRELVYRVLDLPPSMRPLVYDFGQLNNKTEKDYTHQIVTDRCQDITQVMGQTNVIQSVSQVLSWSQKYMRKRKDECSFVSLRDVERAMIVFKYFCDKNDLFTRRVTEKAKEERQKTVSEITRALILAVSVCYHARLRVRKKYEDGIVQQFTNPLVVTGRDQFCNEIRWCQDVLLDNMKLGPNIARNAALRENVFMMAICIELRIPLFLVGKPGSSKSLAKSIVADSMLGRVSDKELIREFKEVHMFSYQCSQLSTPVSVIEVFKTAKGFQEKQNVKNYVSVVVLDEVGLAEDSPNLPLKALHPLLEDGTEGADATEQIIMREERVAFIGISNWALDPAKMNRGVMVTRGDPDVDELVLSAGGICSNEKNDPVREKLNEFFKPLASAYIEICKKQEEKQKPFFGLRDFYSLIKMLYWMCKKSERPLTGLQLQHAIKRNFGGLDVEEIDTYGIFKEDLRTLEQESDLIDESLRDILAPDCSPLGLIKKSLQTKEVSWHGENRYLLFLTENYAALHVIKHYLHKEVGLSHVEKEEEMSSMRFEGYGLEDSFGRNTNEMECIEQRMEPFVLFGSSFPKDREYTQVCRNINQIKICMETGRTVILLNLENLYESLYDLLNQYYIHHGDQRYVDLGLQTHRVKCRVHHNFKLILIAEKATVYKKFPTPLINRLEKHFVLSETVLLEWQKEVLENLICWINKFSDISGDSKFTKHDAFVGYQSDTPASVIFQATHLIQQESHQLGSHEDLQEAVFECSKKIFLQMASPEALIRLKYTSLADEQQKLSYIYFFEQHHGSIVEFLNHYLHRSAYDSSGLLIQVTTHSHLLSKQEVNDLFSCLDVQKAGCFLLQEFDTEMNFSHKVSPSFSVKNESLLIIQCDSGHLYGDLLACARYRIDDEREKSKLRHTKGNGSTHVLFLIHLPRQIDNASSSFVGFQGGSWISAHIDDIRPPLQSDFTLDDAQSAPISQLFYNGLFVTSETISSTEQVLSVEMKEDSEMTGSDEEMVTDTLFEEEPQLWTEEGNISDNTVLYDDGLRIEDLDELTVHETMYDKLETSEYNIVKMNDEVGISTKVHFQCIRLYNCIQAAVASLMKTNGSETQAASAMRVEILLKQIPQNPSFPLDTKTFYGALVKHIRNLLEEREKSLLDQEWVLKEALSGKNLQSGGTFQNVLSRKLDEVIIPIFAAVLLFVDQYSNLNILEHSSDHIIALWLSIFNDDEIVRFDYQNYTFGKGIAYHDLVPGTRQVLPVETEFDCVFPFFWLIKKAIELKWDSIKSSTGDYHRQDVHIQLCDILFNDPVAIVLNKIPEEHWSELCQLYLTDVLKSTHNVPHRSDLDEYEILKKALSTIIYGLNMSPHNSFLSLVSAVHVVYNEYQQEIMWFGRLTALIPGILVKLKQEEYCDSTYFRLPLHAVKVSITTDSLALPLSPGKREYICRRLTKLQLCQNTINSILALSPSDNLTSEIRITWQRVRAVQLFIEHIAMKCSMDEHKFNIFVQYANRINFRLKCEFVKKEAISIVEQVLRVVDREAKSKLKYVVNMQKKVRECCKSYFMEIVSSLCFGQHIPPESDLIIELLNVVFTEQNKTKEFTYSEEEKTDEVPVIRSFLLQLLMEHNMEEVKEHLSFYFKKAQDLIKSDYNLCLLCIQCLEDSIYKQHGQISLQMKIEKALTTLERGKILICHNTAPHPGEVINLEYLEGVSLLRYSLTVVAELIYYQYSNKESERITYTHQSQLLLDMARKCCSEFDINEDDTGPGVFLVKQIARQYGVAFLTHLTSEANMQWVIPHNLRHSDDVETNPVNDPFVIYENYGKMHSILANAVYGKDLTQLQATVQTLVSTDVVPLVLGVYQVVTGSAVFTAESKIIPDDIKGDVMATIRHCEGFTRNMKWIVQHLIEDTYYGRLDIMTLRPGMSLQNRLFTDLIIHVAIAIQCTSNKLLTPFIQMMTQPGVLKECFLPTMPQDSLPDVRNAIIGGGQFYECPRGHPYFVSECGRPVQQYICPICHSRIGGQNHKLESTNRTARTTDITETGYALGQPHQRESTPSTERSLSLPACAIIRALMHCSLLWSSCTNEPAMGGLFELVKTQVKPNEMSLFFWHHLKHDIAMLSTALGKSQDDVCLVLHMILKNIATLNPRGTIVANLHSKELRNQWEKIFSDTFIKPVLMNIDANLHEATVLQMNNKREDCDRLFYVIHEKVQLPPNIIIPHLWSYRSRITLKHLLQVLQTKKESHPILHEFLIQEQFLRATQYLPFIVKLQQQMFNLSHKKLDRKEATELTIRDYLNSFKQSKGFQNENKRNQFKEKLNCTIKAWNLVKERLKDARVQVDPNIVISLTWDESTSLSYLIPTLTGDGACTVALVGVLVQIHNDFIEKCESQLRKEQKMRNNKVPASQIQICHLLDYEHQIMSIVLSHCHYSLKHGKGQDVTYDFPALEKHIVDRFIYGKPYIQLELPQVVYRKEVHTAEAFANIRKNVQPQKQLTREEQIEIVNELGSMQRLRKCLDVVEIVIGFLSSGKSNSKTELKTYIHKVLRMDEKRFASKKAMEYCTLGHILSLWEVLSVQMAKCLTVQKQEAFDSYSKELMSKLNTDQEAVLLSYLKGIKVPPLINLLFEFIETTVCHYKSYDIGIDWPLRDTLYIHLENNELENLLPEGFQTRFPESVTVGQSVETWKTIVIYQHKHEQKTV